MLESTTDGAFGLDLVATLCMPYRVGISR